MILLEIQCPRCKKVRRWLSYNVKKREDIFQKRTSCYDCGKEFIIKGSEVDRIVRVIRFDGDR